MDSYEYTDESGDTLRAKVVGPAGGRQVLISADSDGVLIPLEGIDEYLEGMQRLAAEARARAVVDGLALADALGGNGRSGPVQGSDTACSCLMKVPHLCR